MCSTKDVVLGCWPASTTIPICLKLTNGIATEIGERQPIIHEKTAIWQYALR
jgi:hypothetical protein